MPARKTSTPAPLESASPLDDLPSLRGLVAFDVTVRLGSMTAAASELDTTQPTISQRIRALEEHLGHPLFDRQGGRLILNHYGETFHAELAGGLGKVCSAVTEARRKVHKPTPRITIAAGAGFAHVWLRPRLERLEQDFPDCHFTLLPIDRDEDPQMQQADIAIRFGPPLTGDHRDTLVVAERAFPVCSPDYARRHGLEKGLDAEALARITLLHLDMRDTRWLDWATWCRHAGLPVPRLDKAFPYNNFPLTLNAAVNHQGVALGWSHVIQDLLDNGSLIALTPHISRDRHGYRMSVRHPNSAVIQPITRWLTREFSGLEIPGPTTRQP
ncbi:LysR substrate-binding domain-containing protein [Cobetia sp. BMC6]|uniref:LysR substrate-binding domain-containing protein n=1 Tax=Cobetia TaxID=204286 RepID=UPI0015835D89|nr:LysR substrate-binding domain-containing protein [Cobetia sp. BMC6]MDI4660180.1 LysR substrate-binding domain-containing protein [Cobetia sp. BMC6]NUJ56395.1 LysR family transcriptional regulator [Cobetia marina]